MKASPPSVHFKLRSAFIVLMSCFAAVASAMDWDTAAEVATCHNRPGYQELANRVVSLLGDHQIHSMVMYFAPPDKNGVEALTIDAKQAGGWGVYVDVHDAARARRLVADAIKAGLDITLSTKDPDPTPEVSARPK